MMTLEEKKERFFDKRDEKFQKYDNSCAICGARLGENNYTGIGYTCYQKVVIPAMNEALNTVMKDKLDALNLDFYIRKAKAIQKLFIETFEGRKFRKEFKTNFYNSISIAERLSNKQLDIMITWLNWELNPKDKGEFNCYQILDILESNQEAKKEAYKALREQSKYEPEYQQLLEKHMWYNKIDKNILKKGLEETVENKE
jgi:hypothetical protein